MNKVIIEQNFLPRNHPARPCLPLKDPSSITIHWIGPFPNQTPEIVRNWWLKGSDGKGIEASAHFIVKDKRIMQCIPLAEVAWHCGSKGNYTSFGIEVIPADTTGRFSSVTIETLIYCVSLLPKLELLRHFDWTQKDCPRYYTSFTDGETRWKELKALINAEAWNENRAV
jgi:N-acetylmuramoyl-L-alanine amidase